MGEILTFGVPTTPALVIDGAVRVAGRVPDVAEIKSWLALISSELPLNTPAVSSSSEPEECCCGETAQAEEESPCCGPPPPAKDWSTEPDDAAWIVGTVDTPAGPVPKVSTTLKWTDRLGSWKARWGIRRMRYWVKPRLYAVGSTQQGTPPVFVSANYKMSFDRLRSALAGIDGWILVLDTKGINVWCAAGKGTFGTDELVRQLNVTNLPERRVTQEADCCRSWEHRCGGPRGAKANRISSRVRTGSCRGHTGLSASRHEGHTRNAPRGVSAWRSLGRRARRGRAIVEVGPVDRRRSSCSWADWGPRDTLGRRHSRPGWFSQSSSCSPMPSERSSLRRCFLGCPAGRSL